MRCRAALAIAALVCRAAWCAGEMAPQVAAGDLAANAPDWQRAATDALAQSCAARQLRLRWPVRVRPMAAYDGGYTTGVGSVEWAGGHAEIWRAGWCAIGVYCAPPGANAPGGKRFAAPQGLYSHPRATIYVRDPKANTATRATVAHEAVHALQFQNFPALGAAHLWFNRDLRAAIDAATEGDAHVVGGFFEPRRRRHLCSMAPAEAPRALRDWWRWTPHAFTALESFPHVFGQGLVFARLLAGGTQGVDALLRDPPLSSLAVLRPERAGLVDFIALPRDLPRRIAGKRCAAGLANTVGAVGIWGLLAQHEGGAVGAALPDFLTGWAGDRFLHVVCDGERNDELAWLTRWRSAAAATEFAGRFRAVAAAAARRGGVLDGPAEALVRGDAVLVATAGLVPHADAIHGAAVRPFARYADWLAADCFPYGCRERKLEAGVGASGAAFACAATPPLPAFEQWLQRARAARARAAQLEGERLAFAKQEAARLAVFCALNARRNSDLLAACRAGNFALRYLSGLADDRHWRLLPLCVDDATFRAQLSEGIAAAEDGDGSALRRELRLRAAAVAAAALAADGVAGVERLAAAPPLSTLALLDANFRARVRFFRLPADALAADGCEVLASDVVGALGIWARLPQPAPAENARPEGSAGVLAPLVRAWRGDRQWYLRCGERRGWVWVSRWANRAAARDFAAQGLPALGDATITQVRGRTVWSSTPAFDAGVLRLVRANVESRAFATFGAWTDAGCYPLGGCVEGR